MVTDTSPSPVRALRTAGTVLCALLAGACFAGGLGLAWLQDHMLSPSGFQGTSHSVITDTQFQSELVTTLLERASLGVLDEVRTGIDPIDRGLDGFRERVVDAAESFATAPEQQQMWREVLVQTHAANVPLSPSMGEAPENLVVDLNPVGTAVDERVREAVGVDPSLSSQDLAISVPGTRTGGVIDAVVWAAQWRFVLPWFAGALGVTALLLSPRRWLAVAGVGLAAVMFTGGLLLVGSAAAESLVSASSIEPVANLVVREIVGLLRESFVARCVTGMVWAGVVALVGVSGAVVRRHWVTYH